MDLDIAQTAASAVPYVMATAAAYGMGTVDKVRDKLVDKASDASVNVGHRLLNVLLRRDNPALKEAVEDLAAGEEGSDAVLRIQIRKALTADPELAREVAAIMPVSSRTTLIGAQFNTGPGTFIGGDNHGTIEMVDAKTKASVHAVLAKQGVHVRVSDLFSAAGTKLLDELALDPPFHARVVSLRRLIDAFTFEIDILAKRTTAQLARGKRDRI